MITLEEFTGLVAEQFEETERNVFVSNTKFHEIEEWSSIVGLSIMAMVDEEFGVALKGEDIRTANTIEDLYLTIVRKFEE